MKLIVKNVQQKYAELIKKIGPLGVTDLVLTPWVQTSK